MESNNPILSIIIPMYNCESVIARCLGSLDYPDAEIIVVDDGSTDSGAAVVEKYIGTHFTPPNVKIIKKSNGGVSSARNIGIQAATGKYIMFVDADDYVASGGICRIVEIAELHNADIVTYGNISKSCDDPLDNKSLTDFKITAEIIEGKAAALRKYTIPDYLVWRALFLRSIIVDNNLRFKEDLHLHEDDTFMGCFYCHTSKVVCTDLPLYCYVCSSPQSSTHNQPIDRSRLLIESSILAIKYRSQYIKKVFPDESFPLERYKYMRWICNAKQALAAGYTLREYKEKLNEFRKLGVWPLSYKWIKVAGFDYSLKAYTKKVITTFLLNHHAIGYSIEKLRRKNLFSKRSL